MNRTLTQKYDMHALRALQTLEKSCSEKLVELTGQDEDDLGVELDLLRIFNMAAETRNDAIVSHYHTYVLLNVMIYSLCYCYRKRCCPLFLLLIPPLLLPFCWRKSKRLTPTRARTKCQL